MPNHDMGTAEGRIRLTYEDRGSDKATAALIKMHKQMQETNKRLARMEEELVKSNQQLVKSQREFEKTSRATRGFSSEIFNTRKSFASFRRDTKETIQDLQSLYAMLQKGRQHFRTFGNVAQVLNNAANYNNQRNVIRGMTIAMAQLAERSDRAYSTIGNASRGFTRNLLRNERVLLGTRSAVTLLAGSYVLLRDKVLGVGKALDRSPQWVQSMQKLNAAVFGVSAGMLALSRIMGPKFFEIFAKGAVGFSNQLEKIGRLTSRVFGRDITSGWVARLRNADSSVNKFLNNTDNSVIKFSRNLRNASGSILKFANDSKSLIAGLALLTSSVNTLWKRFQWFFKLPKPIMAGLALMFSRVLPTALHVFGKALTGTSNLLMGLLDGIKQLGGGLAVIPGLIATVAAGITGLVPLFKGLGDQLKDVFDTDFEKSWEAWSKLPAHLRPLAQSIKDIIPRWKELQTVVQTVGFEKIEQDIKRVSDEYFPIFERGSVGVVSAVRRMKDEFVGFLLAGQTQTDTNSIYSNTAASINQLAKATRPAAEGLRDMAVVGTEFIRTMSAFGPRVTQQFADWAARNRENGNLMRWMQDARSGLYDLYTGLKEATGAAWTLLTIFKSNEGGDWLQRFADYMEVLNKRAKESAISGWMARMREGAKNMGAARMEEMNKLFGIFGELIREITPFVGTLSDAFSDVFVPALSKSMEVIGLFLQVLNSTGLANAVGWTLGFAGAVKLLPQVFATSLDGIKAFSGGILVLANRKKVVDGLSTGFINLADKLQTMGRRGGIVYGVGLGLEKISGTAGKLINIIGALATTATIAGTAFLALFGLYQSGSAHTENFNKQLEENNKNLLTFKDNLKEAFTADRGLVGSNVMGAVSSGLDQMMRDVENTADTAPGIMDHMYDLLFRSNQRAMAGFGNPFGGLFTESDTINNQQQVAQQAKLAAAGLKVLREQGVDLAEVLTSSDTTFQQYINALRQSGEEGAAAARELEKQRIAYKGLYEDVRRVGPAGVQLAEGLKQIGEAGADATAKLDGLKNVLEALGILKTTALQAAADYEAALDEMGSKVDEIISSQGGLNREVLLSGDSFNVGTEQGRAFLDVMKGLGDEYMANVAAGADANEEYKKFVERLGTLSAQTGLSIDELKRLGEQVGLTPRQISIGIQFANKEAIARDYGQVLLAIENMRAKNIQVPIELQVSDAKKVDQELDKILSDTEAVNVNGTNLVIKPGISDSDLQKVINKLKEYGINVGEGAPPTPMPIAPTPAGPGGNDVGGSQIPEREKTSLDNFLEGILGAADGAANEAESSGSKFVDMFAEGMESNPAAKRAADKMAEEILKRFHQSPPKKGPLAAHGDAAKYAGSQFGKSYAGGISSGEREVATAASGMAGAAGGSLRGDAMYEQGKFFGEISRWLSFLENAVDAFSGLADTIFQTAKFISDPFGKGTFFGQRPKWVRDPNISDEQLAQQRADAAQQRMFGFYGSAQRPDLYDPNTGRLRTNATAGTLAPGAGQQEIANYIIDKAMSLGYSRDQANQFLIQAVGESGLSPDATSPNGLWAGIFQFDNSTWESAGGGDVKNAQQNIDNYFNLAAQRGLTPENFRAGSQLGTQVSIGGPWHPENAAKGHLDGARAAAQQYIAAYQQGYGQFVSGPGAPAIPGNLAGSKLREGEGVEAGLEPAAAMVAAMLSNMFSGIDNIGGKQNRPAGSPQMHTNGRALDVMIGDDLATGDKIAEFIRNNYQALGIQSYIWRNIGTNLVANEGGGPGSTYTAGGHFDHVHIQFADGAKMDIAPDGTANLNVPANSPYANSNYGLPRPPEDTGTTAPRKLVTRNPDGTFSEVHQGTGDQPGDIPINAATGRPWTPEESAEFWNRPENALQYDQSQLQAGDQNIPGVFQGTQDDLLNEARQQNSSLGQALALLENQNATDEQVAGALSTIEAEQYRQEALNTPASRALASQLGTTVSTAASERGLAPEQNPIDQASAIAGQMSSIAGDIFQVLNSAVASVDATKQIADTLVRGVSNTEDIFRVIDNIQTYIQLGADIAGAVSSVSGGIGAILGAAGGADPSGGASGAATAVQAISQIAGLVQSGFETANAIIDLAQEAYRIFGSYFGQYLGYLVGGADGLMGDVKFLLDTQTNQLLAYSMDNPLDKRASTFAFENANPDARNQLIGNINVYGGPGRDPRDDTRQMMWQVSTAGMGVATGQ